MQEQPKSFAAERFLSVQEIRARVFPSRSERWIKDKAKAGEFGDIVRDGKGWLIAESGLVAWLNRHRVQTTSSESPEIITLPR